MENDNLDFIGSGPSSRHRQALDTLQGDEGPPGIDAEAFASRESIRGLAQPAEVTSVVINEFVRVEE